MGNRELTRMEIIEVARCWQTGLLISLKKKDRSRKFWVSLAGR